MISKEKCFYLGKITKPIGLKGEVNVFLDVDSPSTYSKMESFFIEINKKMVPFFISKISSNKSNSFRIKLDGIDHIDSTSHIIGKDVYLPLKLLPKLKDDQFYYHEIIGFEVFDNNNLIGTIKEVIDNPVNPLFVILNKDKIEILVPIQNQFLGKIDKENNKIHVLLPEGFLDIYTS